MLSSILFNKRELIIFLAISDIDTVTWVIFRTNRNAVKLLQLSFCYIFIMKPVNSRYIGSQPAAGAVRHLPSEAAARAEGQTDVHHAELQECCTGELVPTSEALARGVRRARQDVTSFPLHSLSKLT